MKLRSHDPKYLAHVERWWNVLLGRLAPFLYSRGGPIVMVQVGPLSHLLTISIVRYKELVRHKFHTCSSKELVRHKPQKGTNNGTGQTAL